jgi:hypothetical protein
MQSVKNQKAAFISTRLFDLKALSEGFLASHHFTFICTTTAFSSTLCAVVILKHSTFLCAFVADYLT